MHTRCPVEFLPRISLTDSARTWRMTSQINEGEVLGAPGKNPRIRILSFPSPTDGLACAKRPRGVSGARCAHGIGHRGREAEERGSGVSALRGLASGHGEDRALATPRDWCTRRSGKASVRSEQRGGEPGAPNSAVTARSPAASSPGLLSSSAPGGCED